MRNQVLVALALLIPAGACHGQGDDGVPPRILTGPDHLVPIYPGRWAGEYWRLYRKELQLPVQPEAAVMVYLPSFDPEECLVIHETKGERPTYTLVHTRADRNIWYSMPQNSEDGKRKHVIVTRREVTLPPGLAERVCGIWERMLRGVRYPAKDPDFDIVDGEMIEFWRHGMFGQTLSPDGGAPKLFVELGRSLIKYCSASTDQRPVAQKDVEAKCRALEQYLDKQAASKPLQPTRPTK
jgi:hypothetical protein